MGSKKKSSRRVGITVINVGRGMDELDLPAGTNLGQALLKAGHGEASLQSIIEGVRVNREPQGLDYILKNGDTVVVAAQAKGGSL